MRLKLVLASFTLLAATPVFAQSPLGDKDRHFVQEAGAAGAAEIDAGKLASEKASSPEVKAFAQRMVTDHTKLADQLKETSQSLGAKPASEPDAAHKNAQQSLRKLSGEAFDKQYVKDQLKDHEAAVSLFEAQAKSGQNEKLKTLAQDALPVLYSHLDMVKKLSK